MMMVKVVYHLPYRQLIGFLATIFKLMGLDLLVPHFTTVAERARSLGHCFKKLSKSNPKDLVFDSSGFKIYGEGEWKVRTHGKQKRRRWKKFHIGIYKSAYENDITFLAPPRSGAVVSEACDPWIMPRNDAISQIIGLGNDGEAVKLWKKLFSKNTDNQYVELLVKARVMNEMTRTGIPRGGMVR